MVDIFACIHGESDWDEEGKDLLSWPHWPLHEAASTNQRVDHQKDRVPNPCHRIHGSKIQIQILTDSVDYWQIKKTDGTQNPNERKHKAGSGITLLLTFRV